MTQPITVVNSVSTQQVPLVTNLQTIPVINSVSLSTQSVTVARDIVITPRFVTVLDSISGEIVNVFIPTNEEINATSLFAGNGLLVVNEITGNIAIYPVCKIQSAELD